MIAALFLLAARTALVLASIKIIHGAFWALPLTMILAGGLSLSATVSSGLILFGHALRIDEKIPMKLRIP